MTTGALWRGLLAILKAIGSWIADRIRTRGAGWITAIMEDRIDAFKRRLKRAKAPWRRRWLRGRIARWTKALAWLTRNAIADVQDCCVQHRTAIAKLPLVAPAEKEPKRRAAA